MRRTCRVLASFASLAALSGIAGAHIEMLSPTPRYTVAESGDNKACPCGLGDSNRLCDVEGDRSDSNRASSSRVTELVAGSNITLRWDEYVGHSGRYRVAIDYDGADLEDFNQNILLDIPDPSGNSGNIGQGSIWQVEVQLPNISCDSCTLQLIQMMDGNTEDPVLDPVGRSSYYTCADIVLTGGTPQPDAGPGDNPPSSANGGCSTGQSGSSVVPTLFLLLWARRRHERRRWPSNAFL